MWAFVCMPGFLSDQDPARPSFHLRHVRLFRAFRNQSGGSRGGGDCSLFVCVCAQVCVYPETRGPDGMVWTGRTTKPKTDDQKLCVCEREGASYFRRTDIQYVGVYFCIWDSDDLKTGWKPNLKHELSSVHMYAHVLSSKLCRHLYPSITTVHSEDTPTAFDLQPHTHTSLHLVLNCVGLVLERLNSQLYEGAMFLARPIQNQLAVEK